MVWGLFSFFFLVPPKKHKRINKRLVLSKFWCFFVNVLTLVNSFLGQPKGKLTAFRSNPRKPHLSTQGLLLATFFVKGQGWFSILSKWAVWFEGVWEGLVGGGRFVGVEGGVWGGGDSGL